MADIQFVRDESGKGVNGMSRRIKPVEFPTRMAKGKMLRGPDHFGCINTGYAPVLLHSRILNDHPTVARGYRFAVGPELYVSMAVEALIMGRIPAHRAYHEKQGSRSRVTFCKTYATAKARYQVLRDAILQENAVQAATVKQLRTRARNGDVGAAIDLMDF